MTRLRTIELTLVGALSVAGPIGACSSSSPRDVNYGTDAGADFDAPVHETRDDTSDVAVPDADDAAEGDTGAAAADAGTGADAAAAMDVATGDATSDGGTG
jgi:hypothetical protein